MYKVHDFLYTLQLNVTDVLSALNEINISI